MDENEKKRLKNAMKRESKKISKMVKEYKPGAEEAFYTTLAASAGGGMSYTALTIAGTSGLSAAGITSGLATIGGIVGGGMVAGIGVLALPVLICGVGGYAIVSSRKRAKFEAAINQALKSLYNLQERMLSHAEYLNEELDEIRVKIKFLKSLLGE